MNERQRLLAYIDKHANNGTFSETWYQDYYDLWQSFIASGTTIGNYTPESAVLAVMMNENLTISIDEIHAAFQQVLLWP